MILWVSVGASQSLYMVLILVSTLFDTSVCCLLNLIYVSLHIDAHSMTFFQTSYVTLSILPLLDNTLVTYLILSILFNLNQRD